ncbi:MAG: hypothetical protein ONB48_02650 [candidate division KSB1 bacterium]|nr:hypothetical protein [candidate division KSB1 bacterium]MDZ7275756.1 hypothetical protein [candidate division KSB1 bacterium]MDZ7284553.1 hypothetical protein [candidate division KSB1 bacterium]MDZ7298028.1 hypothetical protein [candidate division KSB1 bacterium]MDZ7307743.1 hypothetical protein [candidate division KSB1 bacterium]
MKHEAATPPGKSLPDSWWPGMLTTWHSPVALAWQNKSTSQQDANDAKLMLEFSNGKTAQFVLGGIWRGT